jgi:DNA-binding transcriptional ArsR family regulator
VSIRVTVDVWEHSRAAGNELLVLLRLADAANEESREAWPSVGNIAARTKLSERTVQRALRSLAEAGEIEVVEEGGRSSRGYRATVYRVLCQQGRQVVTDVAGATPEAGRGDSAGTAGVTPVSPQPSKEPSGSVLFSPPAREPVSYRGRRVAPLIVSNAEALLLSFSEAVGRSVRSFTSSGKPTPELKQVVGALLSHEDVTPGQWLSAIEATVANPPGWVEGPLQLGHVFGERAAAHALAAGRGEAAPVRSNGNGGTPWSVADIQALKGES